MEQTRSVHLKPMKREGFYGVIKTRGSVKPLNDTLLDEKDIKRLRKRGFTLTFSDRERSV